MATDKSIELILYEEIKSAIETNATEFKDVVVWNNQTEYEEQERPYLYPYAAIEVQVNDWNNEEARNNNYYIDQPQQKGLATVTVRFVFKTRLDETDSYIINKPIAHKGHRAINGLSYEEDNGIFNCLQRTDSGMDTDHDSVMVLTYTYQTMVIESGIEKEKTTQTATSIDITRDLEIDNNEIRTADEL